MKTADALQAFVNNRKQMIMGKKNKLLFCLGVVFFWGMIAHAYGFLHTNASHDVLNAFIATPVEDTWKLELGRYFVPVYRAVFRGNVTQPWLIGLLGLLWTGLAVFMVDEIFQNRSRLVTCLVAGLMVTNITYIAQIATYVYEFDFNAFSMMLSVAAVYFWHRHKHVAGCIPGVMFLTISMGIYQAYFAVTVTLLLLVSLQDLFGEKPVKTVFFRGLLGVGMLLASGIAYWAVGKAVYAATGVTAQGRTDVFDTNGANPLALIYWLLVPALTYLKNTIVHSAYPGTAFPVVVWVLAGMTGIAAVWVCIRRKFKWDRLLLICLLTAALPFGMICIYFLARGRGIHDLMVYAVWFFYIGMVVFAFRLGGNQRFPGWCAKIMRSGVCLLVLFILGQNVMLANTAYVKKEIAASSTFSTMTRVVARMEQHEAYVKEETTVAFIGAISNGEGIYGMEQADQITGVTENMSIPMDTSVYYYNAYRAYFDYVLRYPIELCSDEVHAQLKEDPRVQEMPAYPAQGCIEMIDGVMVVKIG